MFNKLKFAVATAMMLAGSQAAALSVNILQSSALGSDPIPTRAVDPSQFTVVDNNPPNGIGVDFNVTGSVTNDRKSLYSDQDPNDPEVYQAVRIFTAATWDRAGDKIRFIWGSPDAFNTLRFLDANDDVIDAYTGDQLAALAGVNQAEGWVFAEFTPSASFSSIRFTNNTPDAYEIGLAAVPVPAAGLMLLSAIAGLGYMRRRKAAA